MLVVSGQPKREDTKSDPTGSVVVKCVNIFKTEKIIEIQLVMETEVFGKVCKMAVKTALLFSNVIDADHQSSCLFTNKGPFSSSSWVLIAGRQVPTFFPIFSYLFKFLLQNSYFFIHVE